MQAPPMIFIKFCIRRHTISEINQTLQKAELPEAARLKRRNLPRCFSARLELQKRSAFLFHVICGSE